VKGERERERERERESERVRLKEGRDEASVVSVSATHEVTRSTGTRPRTIFDCSTTHAYVVTNNRECI
jgi:hypothetical protein